MSATAALARPIQVCGQRLKVTAFDERYTVTVQTYADDTATAMVITDRLNAAHEYSISAPRVDPAITGRGTIPIPFRTVRLLPPAGAAPAWCATFSTYRAYTPRDQAHAITPAEAIRAYLDANAVW